jgi:cytochrome c biogenesis protein CcmG, thiol:disulfide interchange protein DsbE
MRKHLLIVLLVLSACGPGDLAGQDLDDLPPITGEELAATLAESGRPAVVNIWASWCGPCRSEAPLLTAAHAAYGREIDFIGVDVQDNQADAKNFIAEFGLDFTHYFDRNRSVPDFYGGFGTPITFFFDSAGTLVDTHLGVIDERGLALGIDEIASR